MAPNDNNKTVLNPAKWVDNHGDYLYNYAYVRTGKKETAEDLVQETLIAAWKAKERFRGDSSEQTWLTAILKRKIIDHYRKKSTEKESSFSSFSKPFQDETGMEGHWILDRAPRDWSKNSDTPLNSEEFEKIMEYCLSLLPGKWKSVFVLKVMEELETDTICKEIGCTASNLWVILHRARLKLRECIEKNWLQ